MEYKVMFKGEMVELPQYSLEIAEKIEKTEQNKLSTNGIREQLKMMYDCLASIIGKTEVKSVLGEFAKSDPNDINILYLEMIKSFNEPYDTYQSAAIDEKLDMDSVEKMTKLLDAVGKSNIMTTKNGVPFKTR